jgi:hypothetical protein
MLIRLIDFLKSQQITAFMTTLTNGGGSPRVNRRGHFLPG